MSKLRENPRKNLKKFSAHAIFKKPFCRLFLDIWLIFRHGSNGTFWSLRTNKLPHNTFGRFRRPWFSTWITLVNTHAVGIWNISLRFRGRFVTTLLYKPIESRPRPAPRPRSDNRMTWVFYSQPSFYSQTPNSSKWSRLSMSIIDFR